MQEIDYSGPNKLHQDIAIEDTELKPELKLDEFGRMLIHSWRNNQDDEECYKTFNSLNKDDLRLLIDILIEEIEEIKSINKLIRLKESLNAIFDLKLLYNNLKITILNSY